MNENEMGKLFSAFLSTPWMSEPVKLDAKVPRKAILLLQHVVEKGLAVKEGDGSLLKAVGDEGLKQLKEFTRECLEKSGLTQMSQSISEVHGK